MRRLLAVLGIIGLVASGAQAQAQTKATFKVSGMGCDSCADAVEKAAKKIDGVAAAKVTFDKGTAEIVFDPHKTSAAAIAKLLTEKSGYKTEMSTAQEDAVPAAFQYYEAIRAALAADHLKDVSANAAALAPLAEKIGGADARKAAEAVGAAKDLKTARQHFGPLSAALLPAFEKARMTDVSFFTCSMVQQSWAQKGKDVQNPYYGKSMLTCGTPKK